MKSWADLRFAVYATVLVAVWLAVLTWDAISDGWCE